MVLLPPHASVQSLRLHYVAQSVDINTPTINENTVGKYKGFGLKNSCIALMGLCEIAEVKKKCSSECAVWSAKDGPCAESGATTEVAKTALCSVFAPTDAWIKMGLKHLPDKTCQVGHQCDLEMATSSRCKQECDALAQACDGLGVVLEPYCAQGAGACSAPKYMKDGTCADCPVGSTCDGSVATACAATKYVKDNQCVDCPAGFVCNGAVAVAEKCIVTIWAKEEGNCAVRAAVVSLFVRLFVLWFVYSFVFLLVLGWTFARMDLN